MINPKGKEIVALRIGHAIFWNVVFQIGLLKLFVFTANINLTNPFIWFKNVTFSIFSLGTWGYLIPLVFVTFAQGIVSCKEYLIPPKCANSRFENLKQVFSVYNIIVGFLYAYIGLSIPLIYSSDIGGEYSNFIVSCEPDSCISENRLFLVLGGVWVGLYYFIHHHLFRFRTLSFPFIQQKKLHVFKSSLLPSIKFSIRYSLTPMMLYFIFYYLKGVNIRNIFSHIFGPTVFPGNLDGIINMLSPTRIFYLWLFSTIIILTLKMMEVTVKLYLTQRHIFHTFISPLKPARYFILEEALMRSDIPIIQHLGYLDLVLLAEMDMERRREVFTLSQPGGHPYTWNGIKKECFNMIKTFTATLNDVMKQPAKSVPTVSPNKPLNSRFESTDYFISSKENYPLFCTETLTAIVRSIRKFLVEWIFCKITAFMETKIMKFMFGVVAEFKLNFLILHSLPVIWAAESLSFLVCFSLTEDEFGIVQNDIPSIISCLLNLKISVESLNKQANTLKKGYRFDGTVSKMHKTLLSAVKRSLYRIAVKFKPFISDLQLAREDEKNLTSFLSFRE